MKKFFAKLMNWQSQRDNNAETIFNADQQDQTRLTRERQEQERLTRERHEQIMENRKDRKYVSERTIPTEREIEGPSESKKA